MRRAIPFLTLFLAAGLFMPLFAQTTDEQVAIPANTQKADEQVSIPANTTIETTLTTLLSAKTSQEGDPFSAEIVEPIFSHGQEVVPAGSMLEGHVAFIREPGRVTGKAQMRLVADRIVTKDGSTEFPFNASLQNAKGAEGTKMIGQEGTVQGPGKSIKGTAIESGIGAGVGAGVGAIAAGGTGALYGLGAGAIAGIIHNLAKKHKDLILPQGTDLTFQVPREIPGRKSTKSGEPKPFVIPSQ